MEKPNLEQLSFRTFRYCFVVIIILSISVYDSTLVGNDAAALGKAFVTFRRKVMPPSPGI